MDDEIVIEEVKMVMKCIKCRKRGGEDNITAEHLRYRGEWLKAWLKQIFNVIVCLNTSIIKPVY